MTFSGGGSYQASETSSFDLIFKAKDEASAAVDKISTSVKSVGTVAIASATAVSTFMRSFSPGVLGGAAAGLTVLYRSVQLIKTTLESAPARTVFSLLEQQAQNALSEIRPLSELIGVVAKGGLAFGTGFVGGVKQSIFGAGRTMEDRFDAVGKKIELGLQGSILKGLTVGTNYLPKFIDFTSKKLSGLAAEIDFSGIKQDLDNYETGVSRILSKAESFGKLSLAKGLNNIAQGISGGNNLLKQFISPEQVQGLADTVEKTLGDSIIDQFLKQKLPNAAQSAYKFVFGTELSKSIASGLQGSNIAAALPPFFATILGGIDKDGTLYKAIGNKAASVLKDAFQGFEDFAEDKIENIFSYIPTKRTRVAPEAVLGFLDVASDGRISNAITKTADLITTRLNDSLIKGFASKQAGNIIRNLILDVIDSGIGAIPESLRNVYGQIRSLFPQEVSAFEGRVAGNISNQLQKFEDFLAGPIGQINAQKRVVDQLQKSAADASIGVQKFLDARESLANIDSLKEQANQLLTLSAEARKLQREALDIALNPDLDSQSKNTLIEQINRRIDKVPDFAAAKQELQKILGKIEREKSNLGIPAGRELDANLRQQIEAQINAATAGLEQGTAQVAEAESQLEQLVTSYQKKIEKIQNLQNEAIQVALNPGIESDSKTTIISGLNKQIREAEAAIKSPLERFGKSIDGFLIDALGFDENTNVFDSLFLALKSKTDAVNKESGAQQNDQAKNTANAVQNAAFLFLKLDSFLEGAVVRTAVKLGAKLGSTLAGTAIEFVANKLAPGLNKLTNLVASQFIQVPRAANDLKDLVITIENASAALSGIDEPLGLFQDISNAAQVAAGNIFKLSEQFFFLQAGFSSLQQIGRAPFEFLIGQTIELRRQILATQATIAATNKVFADGLEIKDSSSKIRALSAPLLAGFAEIRRESLKISGITSNELAEIFSQVGSNIAAVGGNIKDATDLTLKFGAGLTVLGVPLAQSRQEILSILQGTIDQNSVLAKSLNISNEQLQSWVNQGRAVQQLNSRLDALAAGSALAANEFAGVTSNIREIIDEFGRITGARFLDPILKELNQLFEKIQSGPGQINRELLAYGEKLAGLVERIGKSGYVIITTLIGSFKDLGQAIPIYLLTYAAQAFEVLATTIQATIQTLQPAINVLAKIFEYVVKAEKLYGPIFQIYIATKLLAGVLGFLTKGFATAAQVIPGLGEALFAFKVLTSDSIKELLVLQNVLGQGGRKGWGAAGFLVLGKNLEAIPGAIDLLRQKFGAFGGVAAGLIPKLSSFAITLFTLGQQFPIIGTAIDLGIKIILKGAPVLLRFLATLAQSAAIAGVSLGPLSTQLDILAKQVERFADDTQNANFFNKEFKKTLGEVGQAAGKAAVGLALSIGKFAAFFLAADVAFKLFERFTAKSTTDIADAAAKTSKDLDKMRQAWDSTSKDLATSPKISVSVLEGDDYLDKIIEKLREVYNLKNLLTKPESDEGKLLAETGVGLKNFEQDFRNLQKLIDQNKGPISPEVANQLSARVNDQLSRALDDKNLSPATKAKIKALGEKLNESLRAAAQTTELRDVPFNPGVAIEVELPKDEALRRSREQAKKAKEAFDELQNILGKQTNTSQSRQAIEELGKALEDFKRKADGSGNTATKELKTFYESVLSTFANGNISQVTDKSREQIRKLVEDLPNSIPLDTKKELEKAILDAFPVGTDLKLFREVRAFDGEFQRQFAGISQTIKNNLKEGGTVSKEAFDEIADQISRMRIPVQQKEQLLDFLSRELPAGATISGNALRAFQSRLNKLRPESLKVMSEEVEQAIERTQVALDKLNKSGQGNTAEANRYKQALAGLENYKKQLTSLRAIQEKGDTANSKATQLQAETLKANIDAQIDARRKELDKLASKGDTSSPLALQLRSEILDLEKLNKELETYRSNVELVQNPLEQLKRLQAEFKRATEKATQELTIGETQRQITFQQLLNKGLIRQEQLEAAKIDLTRARLKEELKLAKDQEKKLDELLEKNPELIEEEEFQKQVRESRIKTAQLTLQLLEQEEAAYRKMIDLMKERIERQSQAFANSLEPQKQALQDQLELLELVNKALDNRSRLVNAGKDLFGASVEFQRTTLDVLKQLEFSEIRQQQLAQASALLRLKTLEKEIAFNERALEIEFEKNRLALEREEIQNRIATTEAQIQLNKSEGALEVAQKDKSSTPEERERLRLEVEQRRLQLKNLGDQGALIRRQQEQQPLAEDLKRREQSIKNDTQRLQARGQLFETLNDAQKAQYRRQEQDRVAALGGFGNNSDEFIRGVGQGLNDQLNEVFGKPVQRFNEQFRQVSDRRINTPVAGTEVLEQKQSTPATPKDLADLQRMYGLKPSNLANEKALSQSIYRPDQGIESAAKAMTQLVEQLKARNLGTTINLPAGAVQISAAGADPKTVKDLLSNDLGNVIRLATQKVNQQN